MLGLVEIEKAQAEGKLDELIKTARMANGIGLEPFSASGEAERILAKFIAVEALGLEAA